MYSRQNRLARLLAVFIASSVAITAFSREQETTIEGITAYTLKNGLQVLLCPDASVPTVTVVATYLVGSRHEGTGEAGMAHMLEHLLLGETQDIESIKDALSEAGADYNGTTWYDRTNFFETLPASEKNLKLVLHIEAQRMTQALLKEERLANEIEVISNEFELLETDPLTVLSQQMTSAAYQWHPYGRPVVGCLSDIKSYSIGKLRAFYQKHYRPDNAVLFVGGGFDPERTRNLIDRNFGAILRPDKPIVETHTQEPVQEGPRRVQVQREGGTAVASVMYRVPAGYHPDIPALQVLRELLAAEPSGRLYGTLVETRLATEINFGESDLLIAVDPGVFQIAALAGGSEDPKVVLEHMVEALQSFQENKFTNREIELAKARILKRFRLEEAELTAFGPALSEWIVLGDWRTYFVHRDNIGQITAVDVQRVADNYLLPSNRITGLYEIVEKPMRAPLQKETDLATRVGTYQGRSASSSGKPFPTTAENLDDHSLFMKLPPGVQVALLPKPTRGERVEMRFRIRYGNETDLKGRRAAAWVLPELLARGTQRLGHRELMEEIDLLQSELEIRGHLGAIGASIVTDKEHAAAIIAMVTEILRFPSLSSEDFQAVKSKRLAHLFSQQSSSMERCFQALRRATHNWPESSVHYIPNIDEEIAALQKLTVDDVRNLHSRFIGAEQISVAVVGDFEAEQILQVLGKGIDSWEAEVAYQRMALPVRPVRAEHITIPIPDQRMAVVAMATTLPLRDDNPDYSLLRLASSVFLDSGQPRLERRLRHEEGLSYHVGGALSVDSRDQRGAIFAYAFCSPESTARVLELMREEFTAWIANGITDTELAEANLNITASRRLSLADDGEVALSLLVSLELSRDFKHEGAMIEKMRTLTAAEVNAAVQRWLGDAQFFSVQSGIPSPTTR